MIFEFSHVFLGSTTSLLCKEKHFPDEFSVLSALPFNARLFLIPNKFPLQFYFISRSLFSTAMKGNILMKISSSHLYFMFIQVILRCLNPRQSPNWVVPLKLKIKFNGIHICGCRLK